jgi:recombination protein RecA
MARKKLSTGEVTSSATEDFTADLIDSLNKDLGHRVAYNLASDTSPTHVKRWISTGSKGLDYIIANRRNGGLPEGRIVEVFGPPSIGKSHLAAQICRSTQRMGGIAVYIDTENATNPENLEALGVNIGKRFVYVDTHCTEEVFDIAEKTILKAKALNKDVPITIIWDSVAASSPKAELDGAYDKDTIGLQARVLSKGMRKITGVIGDQSVLFVCLNQIRTKIGVMYGDPTAVPGGNAIPFHSSVRIKLGAGSQIKGPNDEVLGINVSAKTIKNKVAKPFRTANFRIIFGQGIEEHEELFDILRDHGPDMVEEHQVVIEGSGSWKVLRVTNEQNVNIIEKKFYKADFGEIMNTPDYKPWVDGLLEKAMVRLAANPAAVDIDPESYEEVKAVADLLGGDDEMVSPE